MGRFARQFSQIYEPISSDIFKFCAAMNFEPTWQQEQLFDAVMRGHLKIAVRSGQGPGKTTASVIVALWRSMRDIDALTVLTAPTMRQCREVWLAEARRLMGAATPLMNNIIKVTQSKVEICGRSDWGVKTVTANKEENAQGFHQKNMTIICEEASGIPRKIIEQFQGTASNPNCLFLQIGNPNTRDCAFFDCFHSQRHKWATMAWNAEQTPKSDWFDPIRNKDLEEQFGRDSDVYRIRVLGEFPHTDPNCVISSEALERVSDARLKIPCARMMRSVDRGGRLARQFGLDFARYGSDESTIYQRTGNAITAWNKFSHFEPESVVEHAFRMEHEAFWDSRDVLYVADAGGMGQGVMSKFYRAGKNITEFHNNGVASETMTYDNRITEAWFNLADLAKKNKCYIPNENILIQQLSSRRYYTTKKGKFILESKDDYIKRGFDSPDRADGCVMAFDDRAIASSQMGTVSESNSIGAGLRR